MNTPKIKFTEKWDKLKSDRFQVGERFTTVRKATQKKGAYYIRRIYLQFDVIVNSKVIGKVRFMSMHQTWEGDLSDEWIKKDTHESWSRDDFKRLLRRYYGRDNLSLFLLEFEITEVSE